MQPGIYASMTAEEYFDDPCPLPSLTQSLIPLLLKRSPYHFAHAHPRLNPYGGEGAMPEKTMFLGAAVHRLALGRGKDISTIRYPDYTSGSARDARDLAIANGRIPVLERELVKARDMAEIVKQQIVEALDGAPYVTEVVIAWQEQTIHGPIWCRGMIDVWSEEKRMALDPKALRISATAGAFGKTSSDSGYDLQAVFYPRGLAKVFPQYKGEIRFANLVVENYPPHGSQMFEPDQATRQIAENQIAQAMELFALCLHTRSWPGYPKGIQPYSTPTYYQNQISNA